MASDWFEEMEQDEQERDAREYELSLEYKRGKAEGYREAKEKYLEADAYNEGIADGRESAIDDVIKKLAESEDTILTDKQYYTLMEMKEQKNDKK